MVNADGPQSGAVIAAVRDRGVKLVTTGRAGEGIRLVSARTEGFASAWRSRSACDPHRRPPLVGTFQVENALLAAGLVLATPRAPGARRR